MAKLKTLASFVFEIIQRMRNRADVAKFICSRERADMIRLVVKTPEGGICYTINFDNITMKDVNEKMLCDLVDVASIIGHDLNKHHDCCYGSLFYNIELSTQHIGELLPEDLRQLVEESIFNAYLAR